MAEQKEAPKIVKPVNGFTFLEVTVLCVIVLIFGILISSPLKDVVSTELTEILCEGI